MEQVTEWELQGLLTPQWATEGLAIAGRRCLLVAWELMFPSWLTNHHLSKWNEPSIDFVFADETGVLYAFELKRTVASPGDSWRVLAQVTHRAAKLHETRTFEKLQAAFALSRTHEARNTASTPGDHLDLLEHHRAFFALARPLAPEAFTSRPVTRVIGAQRFGRAWQEVLERFTTASEAEIVTHLAATYQVSSAGNRELRRLLELGSWRHLVTPAIATLVVP